MPSNYVSPWLHNFLLLIGLLPGQLTCLEHVKMDPIETNFLYMEYSEWLTGYFLKYSVDAVESVIR